MDILGVGFSELMVILIIAMIVFGPRRLPEIAGKAGKIVRDLRNMSRGLMLEWQREITVASRLDELEETRKELAELKKELGETQREIGRQTQKDVKQFQKQIDTEVSKAEDTIKTGVEQLSVETAAIDGKSKPDSKQSSGGDKTPETTPEEEPPQASDSDTEQPQEQEATSDKSSTAKPPKPKPIKPKVSRAVKANGRASNSDKTDDSVEASSSEKPSQPKEALNE